MRASVILVNFNNKEDLATCLPSLLKFLGPHDEVIVVDNASTDGSPDWLAHTFPVVKVICCKENLGYAGGNNLGALYANGKYLAFLNPDTRVAERWLDALIIALEKDADIGLATSKILLFDYPNMINTCGTEVHISGITLVRGLGMPETSFTDPENISAISGAAFAMQTELFDTLGGFDECFFMYMEDIDLSWRASLTGAQSLFVPDSVVWHKYKLQFGPSKIFFQERNRYLMLLKSLRWGTLLLMLPTLVLTEIISWGFVLLYDRSNLLNKLKAYNWVAQNWTSIMEKRNQTQAQRVATDRSLLHQTTFRLDFGQTGETFISRSAKIFFTPLFWILRSLILAIIRW